MKNSLKGLNSITEQAEVLSNLKIDQKRLSRWRNTKKKRMKKNE